jgi:hypothetical protein
MCMNCGCGEAQERHKPGDITMEDLEKAAANHDMKVSEVVENIQKAAATQAR